MKYTFLTVVIFASSFVTSCSKHTFENTVPEQNVYFVSILQLISNPEKYTNMTISVSGVFSFDFEDNNLYFSKEAYSYHDFQNAIELSLYEDIYDKNGKPVKEKIKKVELKYKKFQGKRVSIDGTFIYEPMDPLRPFRLIRIKSVKIDKGRNEK